MSNDAAKPKRSRKPKTEATAAAPVPAKRGRRTKYDPSMCEVVIELGRRGRSKAQMASQLEISRSTFDRYLEEHEAFRESYELADTHSQAFWENVGMGGMAKGHLFNDRAWSLQVRNRFPHSYKESRELELGGAGGQPIKVMMIPSDANLLGQIMGEQTPTCTLTPKQLEANELLGGPAKHICLVGGARSGKTFLLVRAICMRALKAARSRHLIARLRQSHVVASIGRDTLPRVLELCFPGVPYKLDQSDWFVTFPNKSEIWLGGLDDKERVEKILGREFATVLLNEVSQIPYQSVVTVRTRLAQKIELVNRMLYDLNPCGQSHWAHRLFVEKVDPHTRAPLVNTDDYASLVLNPIHNVANLPPDYLPNLDALPEKQRLRFKEGVWLAELDNALWSYDRFRRVPVNPFDCQRIVVAVDPSGASGREDFRSDEIGIVVAAKLKSGRYNVLADRSLRCEPHVWARVAVAAYKEFSADLIVAEKNFGGALVEANLRNEDRSVPVKLVTASRGKHVRADSIASLYARGEVDHSDTFPELEAQAVEMTTAGYMGQRSPDRLDALVWALTELSGAAKTVQFIGVWDAHGFTSAERADPPRKSST